VITRIADSGDLERALGADSFLLFKHSTSCPISAKAWREYVRFLEENPDVSSAWIDVHDQAQIAREVTKKTGIQHESPQALWIRDGRVGWHASHFDITVRSLTRAVTSLPKKPKKEIA
jgi:bacillithiol system protein YtxJ